MGAASADPALIAMPAGQYIGAAAQPVYVAAAQPRLGAPQPVLLEQQVMRTPQMATMPHLYNIQPVAAYPHIIPAPQQYIDADTIKEMKECLFKKWGEKCHLLPLDKIKLFKKPKY